MNFSTLVGTDTLAAHLSDERWVVVDCRHDLLDVEAGRRAYSEAHVPGAYFLQLDTALSGPRTGTNGRHPLPKADELAARLGEIGIATGKQVVAYDAHGGMFAARLWWLLRWLGHDTVAVLDGGLTQWIAEGRPLDGETPLRRANTFIAQTHPTDVSADEILAALGTSRMLLVDARSPDRYRGDNETLDPVGGHIPGARNRFFKNNLAADGRFKPAAQLRKEWQDLLAITPPENVVHQCGSGVTACHNLLAMEVAGLPGSRLYPGSWSEWCANTLRPVARGSEE
ncbi:MAG TPA: sulfurtransferase [Burkholderiales bacterium]|nr:sulfurtransferase [Burkholderiales bacterium]